MTIAQVAKRELALECDYTREARCQQRFKALVAAQTELRDHVSVPDVIAALSSRCVLTSEYVPGSHIDKVCSRYLSPPFLCLPFL